MLRNGDFQRPAQHPALYELFKRFHGSSQTIKSVGKAEPGIQAKYPAVSFDGFHYFFPLANCTCHGFLTPDVFTGTCRFCCHNAMPVRRSGNVYHVYIGIVDQVHKVFTGFHFIGSRFYGSFQMEFIYIAYGNKTCTRVFVMSPAHRSHSNDPFRELVTGCDKSVSAENPAGNNG